MQHFSRKSGILLLLVFWKVRDWVYANVKSPNNVGTSSF